MEPPPAKRRRRFPRHSEKEVFDKLPDDLIEKIFYRLPLCSVFRSRCVSKRWLSISTSPSFVSLFERHRNQSEKDHPVVLLLQVPQASYKNQLVVCSGSPGFNCSGFSLDFLPTRHQDPITVLGSCGDLFLCCNESWSPSDYFIVNCITREWVALPPTLRLYNKVLTGFICDPTSIAEAKKGANLRYRVVRIPVSRKPETILNVEIFSSEDGQWSEYAVTCAPRYGTKMWCKRAVTCNRSLYWIIYGGENIMAMDPFKLRKKKFGVIRKPQDSFDLERKTEHLGIHRGKLILSQTIHSNVVPNEPSRLRTWRKEKAEPGGYRWRRLR